MALTAEEEKELQELEAEFSSQDQVEEIAPEQEVVQEPAPQAELPGVEVDPSMGVQVDIPEEVRNPEAEQAFRMGATQAIPFAKDVITGAQALYEGGTENWSERKRTNLKHWEKEYQILSDKYPAHVNTGDFMTSASIFTQSVPAQIVFGAASGASRTSTREAGDLAFGATIGAGSVMAFHGGAKLVGLAAKGVSGISGFVGRQLGLLKKTALQGEMGVITAGSRKSLAQHAQKFAPNETLDDASNLFFNRAKGYTKSDGTPLLRPNQSYSELHAQARVVLEEKGAKLGQVVKTMDDKVDPISSTQLESKLNERLIQNPVFAGDEASNIALQKKISTLLPKETVVKKVPQVVKKPNGVVDSKGDPVLSDVIEMVDEYSYKSVDLTPSKLQDIKLRAARELRETDWANAKLPEKKEFLKGVRDVADELLEDMGSQISKEGGANPYRQANMEWADVNIIAKNAKEASNSNTFSKGRAILDVKQALVRGIDNIKGSKGKSVAIASALTAMANDAQANPEMVSKFEKIKNFVEVNPEHRYAKRILTGAAIANNIDGLDDSPFESAITNVGAELTLLETPIKRNINDIKLKADVILDVMDYYSPMQADALRDALENEDDESIRIALDQLSKMPETQDIFEPGKGIDGRVFSEEDKEMLKAEVQSMDVSFKQKLQHLDKLDKQGIIPVIEEEPERFFRPEWRNKSKPKY